MPRQHTEWWLRKRGLYREPVRFRPSITGGLRRGKRRRHTPQIRPPIIRRPKPSPKLKAPVIKIPPRIRETAVARFVRKHSPQKHDVIMRVMAKHPGKTGLTYIEVAHLYDLARRHGLDFEAHVDSTLEYSENRKILEGLALEWEARKYEGLAKDQLSKERRWERDYENFKERLEAESIQDWYRGEVGR